MILFFHMKRYAFLLVAAGLFVAVSVSRAQYQPPPGKPVVVAIENHHITLPETPASLQSIKPECQEKAFAETAQLATEPVTCAADADYGSCSSAAVMNKNINPKKLFAFRSTIYHSSSGMPL